MTFRVLASAAVCRRRPTKWGVIVESPGNFACCLFADGGDARIHSRIQRYGLVRYAGLSTPHGGKPPITRVSHMMSAPTGGLIVPR